MFRSDDTVVVALGGNALVRTGEAPTIGTQTRNVERAVEVIVGLLEAGCRVVVTHGNGFQVGNILTRVERALGEAYAIPLEVCVAESQGEIGYLIEQGIHNALSRSGLSRPVVSVLTQVVVDPNDAAFDNPTKPIGPYYSAAQAAELRGSGHAVVEESGLGWRKVVASPRPLAIEDVEVIRWLLEKGAIVVAAGGGGVPVVRSEDGQLSGVPAVIDKDLASVTLARAIDADHLVILTSEPCVYLDYQRPTQRALHRPTLAELRRHLEAGQFPPGSMGPKVEAAIEFVEAGGRTAVITACEALEETFADRAGTVVTSESEENP